LWVDQCAGSSQRSPARLVSAFWSFSPPIAASASLRQRLDDEHAGVGGFEMDARGAARAKAKSKEEPRGRQKRASMFEPNQGRTGRIERQNALRLWQGDGEPGIRRETVIAESEDLLLARRDP
jgi:hypothetical protein